MLSPPLDYPLRLRAPGGRWGMARLQGSPSATCSSDHFASIQPDGIPGLHRIHEAFDLASGEGNCVFAAYAGIIVDKSSAQLTVTHHDDGVTLTLPGLSVEVDVERLHSAGPLTPALVAASTACIGLLRWDGRWLLQPLAVESTVKRKTVAVHAGAWAGGASDAAGAKAEAAAADAVRVLRERAGRLLRK